MGRRRHHGERLALGNAASNAQDIDWVQRLRDLRRLMEGHGYSLLDRAAADCMTREPVLVGRRELATGALDLLESRKITSLLVVDEKGRIEGVLHLHDLWKTEMI